MRKLEKEVILLSPTTFAATDKEPLAILESTGCTIIENPHKRRLTKPELIQLLKKGVTGTIAGLEPIDREVMANSKLKVISRCGTGTSNVDLEAAKDLGIYVCNTPDAPVESVAELVLGAMLSLVRTIPQMNVQMHNKIWEKKFGTLLANKTVAIIGFGRIGRRLAQLLKPFNVDILAVDPFAKNSTDNVKIVDIDTALKQADIICIHASGEDRIISEKELSIVKKGVYILNAARGSQIDEDALAENLKQGRVAGAWLDVFEQEPYSGILCDFPQVILTPHVGSYTKECRKDMETQAVNNLISAFNVLYSAKQKQGK